MHIVYLGTSNALLCITGPELCNLYCVYLYNDTVISQEFYDPPTDGKGAGKETEIHSCWSKVFLRSQAWHFPLTGNSLSRAPNY